MFDFSHLPQNAVINEFIGPSSGPSVWNKPPNARLVFMLAIGGGSGGGAGYFATSGGGGGGGGSGSITQALFLAHMIPASLFVYFSGSSGRGAQTSGGSSTAGANVQISNYGSNNPGTEAVFLRANGASAATSGGGSGGGNFGSGGAAVTASTAMLINHAIYFSSTAGRFGALGSNLGSGGSVSIGTGLPIIGGAGGSGSGAEGGAFTSEIPFILPTINGGAGTTGERGSNGVRLPFLFTGGTGGGSESTSGLGGVGGSAIGYGAGGGGGGSSPSGSPNYTPGGNGGPAYACIIAW